MDSYCLALRQQLKEKFRARLRKETGPGAAVAGGKDNAAPADNYGSFFGPSEIVFADRVIQETMSWLENPNFERGRKFKNVGRKKSAEASKIPEEVLQKMARRKKVQCLKDGRDYSFLSSDCEIPVPVKKPNKSGPPEKIQGVQAIKKNSQNRQGFSFLSSDCEIPIPPNINSRQPEKIQGVEAIKKPSETGRKNSRPEKDSQVPKYSKKPSEKKMKSLISKKPRETPCSKAEGRKRKLDKPQEEEENINAISIIREMFGYDPTKFCDDEEDVEMEATFDDIQKEERRSMRIGKKEDDEELRKTLQERKKKSKL
ncbi:uncharacterized protein LOC105167192 [Sesamum indicum]|uniref:Uncharacterized protein LOC105167192 n=1 Tax=Sesamum indicum TaxID=4182 RepID=A0A6I9TV24_SESIN|nr:uncharacterized protein LOC105167192 [Sesamum indicum]